MWETNKVYVDSPRQSWAKNSGTHISEKKSLLELKGQSIPIVPLLGDNLPGTFSISCFRKRWNILVYTN